MKIFLTLFFIIVFLWTGCRENGIDPGSLEITDSAIYLNSTPRGIRIYLNGRFTSKSTPDSLINLNPGIYSISLRSNFTEDTTFNVYLQEGKKENYDLQLRENSGSKNYNSGNFQEWSNR